MLVRTIVAVIAFVAVALWHPAFAQEKAAPPKVRAPYEADHAKPLESKEEIVNKADDHTQYRVEFNGIKDDRVPGYLYVPKRKADAGPCPSVLLQYGSGGNKKTDYIVAIGKQFVARGFVVLTIDSINTGERKNKGAKPGLLGLLGNDQIMHYCGDYSRAVDFLSTRAEVDKDRIGYMGLSWGAITGITYAAYDDRIKAVGSMVGGGNFLGLFTKKEAEKAALEVSSAGDPVYHVARIAPRPLLFVNVTKDQLILKSWAESLHRAAGTNAKVVWHDTDHYFRTVDRAAVCNSVIDFLEKELNAKRK
jgi:dienelactone hydrolase